MPSVKMGRITQDIKRELVDILREVKDPRISKLLSVIKVDVTSDLSYCKVYVSALEGNEKTVESVVGLKSAAGYIRKELARKLSLRKTPELYFIADNSIEYGANINKILEEQKKLHPDSFSDDEEE